jgi:methionyl-tRNA synthetase
MKIAEKAEANGLAPQAFTDQVSAGFKSMWAALDIENNKFIRTTDTEHKAFVQSFVARLIEKGDVYKDYHEGLYCVGCEKYLTEKELVDGKCPDHNREPMVVKEENWFFDLNKYIPQLQKLIEDDVLQVQPSFAKNEVLGLIKQGVPNFAISRNKDKVKWGIEMPNDDSQLIYVWADALSNYRSAVDGQGWWPASVHLIGKDILKFHALYWPAMLLAAGEELPQSLFVHGFFTSNGQKMSKTLGNVIDPADMVEEFGAEATKYLLLSQFPFGQDGDIEADNFVQKYNSDLANGLGNLVNRTLTLVDKFYEGKVPEGETLPEFVQALEDKRGAYEQAFEKRRIDLGIQYINELVTLCDQTISNNELWKMAKVDPAGAGSYFYSILETLAHISWMLYPYMPKTAATIAAQLGITDMQAIKGVGTLQHNSDILKGGILFARK